MIGKKRGNGNAMGDRRAMLREPDRTGRSNRADREPDEAAGRRSEKTICCIQPEKSGKNRLSRKPALAGKTVVRPEFCWKSSFFFFARRPGPLHLPRSLTLKP